MSIAVLAALGLSLSAGCQFDSWMDPSVVGRWEHTPVSLPVLDRIAVIESAFDDEIAATPVQPSDLIPEPVMYRVGPGDVLLIDIYQFFEPGRSWVAPRVVDETGHITLPQIGSVFVSGMTESQIRDRIADHLDPDILRDPVVSVVSETKRENTYNVIGALGGSNLFTIPRPNYRLLDALSAAGGIPETVHKVYVIRQVPLREEVFEGPWPVRHDEPPRVPDHWPRDERPAPPDDEEDDLLRIIDEALEREPGRPGVLRSGGMEAQPVRQDQPETPPIDIAPPTPRDPQRRGDWVYLDGRWVRVEAARPVAAEPVEDEEDEFADLVTQRIIEVPVRQLLAGDARYNIVIRPNDIVRLPAPPSGLVMIQGEVMRGGAFTIPINGRFTLTRAIASAGGLAPLAIPERVEIRRMLSDDHEAIVMLNYRAIMEGAEPDVYLKPDDLVNVGTTWYAAPLAVIRNGFRTTYGFGFLLDRNFGNDVFGPPPVNIRGQ